jgi:hypothetical protein
MDSKHAFKRGRPRKAACASARLLDWLDVWAAVDVALAYVALLLFLVVLINA